MALLTQKLVRQGIQDQVARFLGNWNAVQDYIPGDTVQSGGITYICIVANTNQAVSNTTYWTSISSATYTPNAVYKITTAVDVVSTVAETTFFDQPIAANAMGTDKMLRVTLLSSMMNNSGAGGTPTFRIYWGGTKVIDWTLNSMGSGVTARRPVFFKFDIANLGAANSQYLHGMLSYEDGTTGGTGNATTGEGFNGNNPQHRWFGANGLTVDTTAQQNVKVTAQWSASNANLSWKMWYALLEVVG